MPVDPPPPPAPEPLVLQILDKMSALMAVSLGLVAALAWNEAIKETIDLYFTAGGQLRARYLYAGVITALAVLLSLWIARAINRIRNVQLRMPRLRSGAKLGGR